MNKRKINKSLRKYGSVGLAIGMFSSIATPVIAYAATVTTQGSTITGYFKFDNVAYESYIHNFNVGMDMTFMDGSISYCTMFNFNNPNNGQNYVPTGFPLGNNGLYTIINHGYTGSGDLGLGSSRKAYMATQLAVWWYVAKVAKAAGLSYVPGSANGLNRDYEFLTPNNTINISGSDGSAIYNEAMRLYNLAVSHPETDDANLSFLQGNYSMSLQGDKYVSQTIQYNSNVGSPNLSLVGAPSGARIINRSGDSFQIEAPIQNFSGTFSVKATGTKPFYKYIYFKPSSNSGQQQWEISVNKKIPEGANASAITHIHMSSKMGSIDVTKKNEVGATLAGATFGLYNSSGTEVQHGTTNSSGKVDFTGLTPGTYKVKELSAPSGYLVNSSVNTDTITSSGNTVYNTVVDKHSNGSITVTKENEKGQPLAGAVFGLFNSSGSRVSTETSNSSGVASFPSVPLGKYTIKEITPPTGYLPDTTPVSVDLTSSNSSSGVHKVVHDKQITGNIQVTKIGLNGAHLPGATFTLYKGSSVVATETTDSSGVATFSNIPYGQYTIKETKAPSGYKLSSQVVSADITSEGHTYTYSVTDAHKPGQLTVIKENGSGQKLSGAKFELLKGSSVVGTSVTNGSGVATFNNLQEGSYNIKEVMPPVGYQVNTTVYPYVINNTNYANASMTVIDKKIVGNIKITKTGLHGALLSGAVYGVYQGTTLVKKGTTDSSGVVEFTGLPFGEYQVKEITAPSGYQLSSQVVNVNITQEGKVYSSTVSDQHKPGQITVTKENKDGQKLAGATFEVIQGGKVIQTKVTDANGVAVFSGLPEGTYQVKETKAPVGYVINNNVITTELTNANYTNDALVIKDIKIKGSISVEKLSESGVPLQGAEFGLYSTNGDLLSKTTTGISGIAGFDNVLYGKYLVKEIKAPVGYNLNKSVINVDVTENGKLYKESMKDKIISTNITVTKTNADGKKVLAGAVIGLYNSKGKLIEKATTDKNGQVVFKDVVYGKYTVKEITPPVGYVLDPTPQNVVVSTQGQAEQYKIKDNLIRDNIVIHKVSADSDKPLVGATFGIYNSQGNEVYNGTTDKDGNLSFDSVPYGIYTMKELEAPIGYNLDSSTTKIDVSKNGVTINEVVKDTVITGQMGLMKTSNYTKKPLAGVEFELFKIEPTDAGVADETIPKPKQVDAKVMPKSTDTSVTKDSKVDNTKDSKVDNSKVSGDKNSKTTTSNLDANNVTTKVTNGISKTPNPVKGHDSVIGKVESDINGVIKDLTGGDKDTKTVKTDSSKDGKVTTSVEQPKVKESKIISAGKLVPVGKYKTDESGILDLTGLTYGQYVVKEVQPDKGYLPLGKDLPFQITKQNEVINLSAINKLIHGNVTIHKTNMDGSKSLAGAEFEVDSVDGSTLKAIKKIGDYTTNTDGLVSLKDLPFGVYSVKEIKSPTGYVLNDKAQYAYVTKEGETVTLNVHDKLITGTLDITKENLTGSKLLPDTTFQICNSQGKVIVSGITNKEGLCTFTLPYGKYTYQEIKAPVGYQINHSKYPFEISKNGEIIKVVMKDAIDRGNLIIHKYSETTGDLLAGATFTVYNSAGDKVASATTGEKGMAEFKGLPYGNYTYKETSAPKGYELDKESYKFSISKNDESISVKVDDESLPHTGLSPEVTILPWILALVFGGGFFALRMFTEPEEDKQK